MTQNIRIENVSTFYFDKMMYQEFKEKIMTAIFFLKKQKLPITRENIIREIAETEREYKHMLLGMYLFHLGDIDIRKLENKIGDLDRKF